MCVLALWWCVCGTWFQAKSFMWSLLHPLTQNLHTHTQHAQHTECGWFECLLALQDYGSGYWKRKLQGETTEKKEKDEKEEETSEGMRRLSLETSRFTEAPGVRWPAAAQVAVKLAAVLAALALATSLVIAARKRKPKT